MAWSAELVIKYPEFARMLEAATNANSESDLAHGTIGMTDEQLGNFYSFNSTTGKWRVHSFNRYTTAQLVGLATLVEIPIYTQIINVDTGEVIIEDGV